MAAKGSTPDADRALCPFYRARLRNTIRCDGMDDGITVTFAFSATERMRAHMDAYCCGSWEYCEWACAMLDYRYGDKKTPGRITDGGTETCTTRRD